jgi:hypothetical protein
MTNKTYAFAGAKGYIAKIGKLNAQAETAG